MSVEVKIKHTSTEVLSALNLQLANAYVLSVKYKKFHWYVSGPFFKQLHELFDMHHEQIVEIIDTLAERSRAIGGYPIATMKEFIETAEIDESPNLNYTPQEMVDILYEDTDAIIDSLHQHIQMATSHNDPGTADIFTRIVQTYQKQAWYLAETRARKALV
jgi:starvation-inducible DNA-binding protein